MRTIRMCTTTRRCDPNAFVVPRAAAFRAAAAGRRKLFFFYAIIPSQPRLLTSHFFSSFGFFPNTIFFSLGGVAARELSPPVRVWARCNTGVNSPASPRLLARPMRTYRAVGLRVEGRWGWCGGVVSCWLPRRFASPHFSSLTSFTTTTRKQRREIRNRNPATTTPRRWAAR